MSSEKTAMDIAIVGMSCRFPGGTKNPEDFYDFLMRGGDGIVEVPADRWDVDAYYDADKEKKNKMYVRRGGFIDDIDQFDPQFFGISPKEAPHIDPQHRWLLELTQEALEHAGLASEDLKGSDTGVFIGQFMHDYEQIQLDSAAHGLMTSHSATGPSMTLTANRISYCYDFIGPSVTLDTACSSSLVALDMACKALASGDSRLAIAGGVNILLRPELTMSICKASMLSEDGRCKSFDASANGYVRSEGAGLVVIKTLDDAIADGDKVLAVIKSSGVNQDGHTSGITVPSGQSQQILLQKTLARAGFSGSDIHYAEAHGTGTAVGDPIEVNALGKTLGARETDKPKCVIGSVKSNIGHTEAAAGMAGLIKTVMSMQAGVIPANIHYYNTNPGINLKELNVAIAAEPTPWPDTHGTPKRAIVNSFGFGGTNANVVLESAEQYQAQESITSKTSVSQLLISAKSKAALKDQATRYLEFIRANHSELAIEDICFASAINREHFKHRLVINGLSHEELISGLEDFLQETPSALWYSTASYRNKQKPLAFVFSGMGTTWPEMGRKLYDSQPVFKAAVDRCSQALQAFTDWSLVDVLYNNVDDIEIHQTHYAQPGIFSIQVALFELLQSWGIEAGAIVGHSAGEVAASYCAGALSFDDAVQVIYHRSQLQQTTEGRGKMLAVGLGEEAVKGYLKGYEAQVSIAAINSASAITLSGEAQALEQIQGQLDREDIFARFLKVGVPYHSPVMDELKTPLIERLASITVKEPKLALFSTVTGELTKASDWGAEYWADNVRDPVYFMKAIESMQAAGFSDFVEVAPHSALSSSIESCLIDAGRSSVVATMKRDQDDRFMLANTLAQLHSAGLKVNWQKIYQGNRSDAILPTYAWQHQRYWNEDEQVQNARLNNNQSRGAFTATEHPLMGGSLSSNTHLWQNDVDLKELTYLSGHLINQEVVYPGAAYVEMALTVASSVFEQERVALENIEFKQALYLDEQQPTSVETSYQSESDKFEISVRDEADQSWKIYSDGKLCSIDAELVRPAVNIETVKASLAKYMSKDVFYSHCHALGLNYEGHFQPVSEAWHCDMNALVKLQLSEAVCQDLATYKLHPAVLDGCFQSLFATIDSSYLPVAISRFEYFKQPENNSYGYLRTQLKNDSEIVGDLDILDAQGNVCIAMRGVQLKANSLAEQQSSEVTNMIYNYRWDRAEPVADLTANTGRWLVFADAQGKHAELERELQALGHSVVKVFKDEGYQTQLQTLLPQLIDDCIGVCYLWGLDTPVLEQVDGDAILSASEPATLDLLDVIQTVNRQTWKHTLTVALFSQCAFALEEGESMHPIQAALWGFGRVFESEHPEYQVRLIDLADAGSAQQWQAASREVCDQGYEQEVALREGQRYVHRLVKTSAHTLSANSTRALPLSANQSFDIVGSDADNSVRVFKQSQVHGPDADQVLIKVLKSTLNVQDEQINCVYGEILELGAAVNDFQLGQKVIGLTHSNLSSRLSVSASQLCPVFTDLPEPKLAGLIASFSARVLAAYIDQQLSCESAKIYLHTTGSARDGALAQYLQHAGHQVFVAPDEGFEGVQTLDLAAVNRQGVTLDCVVSARCDYGTRLALDVIKPMGQFFDLSERTQLDVLSAVVDQQASYAQVAIEALLAQPGLLAAALASHAKFQIPADKVHSIEEVALGQWMASDMTVVNYPFEELSAALLPGDVIEPGKSYLVTGGLGGLGLEVMRWLANKGADSIVLVGRREPSDDANAQIDQVRAQGVTVTCQQVDITCADQVGALVEAINCQLPPLAGVIHSAGVLDDATIGQQTSEKFVRVLQPKLAGAWNLHLATQALALDVFVCFSSIAAVVGWAGQSNYSAANSFMDALCHYRQSQGLSGLSINWGPWAEAGMAANLASEDIARMNSAGMAAIAPSHGMQAMSLLLSSNLAQGGVFDLDWSKISERFNKPERATVFAEFVAEHGNLGGDDFADQFQRLSGDDQKNLLINKIKDVLASVLGLESSENLEAEVNVFEYGMNSLMAMDLKNRLQSALDAQLPATLVLKNPTAKLMAEFILQSLDGAGETEAEVTKVSESQTVKVSI